MLIENTDEAVQKLSDDTSISPKLAKRIIDILNTRAVDLKVFNWVICKLQEYIASEAIAEKLNKSTDEEIGNAINEIIAESMEGYLSEITLGEEGFSEDKEYELITTAKQTDFRYGDFQYSKDELELMAKNFNENIVGTEIPVDLNHDPEHIALAWIKPGSMIVRESTVLKGEYSLYGQLYRFTPSGREKVETGALRYFSLQIQHQFIKFVDNVKKTYKLVIRAMALTNMPVIKDMAPTLSESNENKPALFSNHSIMEKTDLELKLAESEVALANKDTLLATVQEENRALAEKIALTEKKERDTKLASEVEGLLLSEENKVGFKGGEKEKVLAFVQSLSDEQAAEYFAIHKNIITTVDLDEHGSGDENELVAVPAGTDPEEVVENMAVELSRKEGIDLRKAYDRVLAENPDLAKKISD